MRLLLLDNFDSFTYTLADYLAQAGAECVVHRNNVPMAQLTADRYDAVVLSPGPGTPPGAGCLMDVIAHYHNQLPVLGVCLGQQAIGAFFGATLGKSYRPMHGKVSTIRVDGQDPLFRKVTSRIRVTRYHSLTLTDLPNCLTATAISEPEAGRPGNETGTYPGEVMAIRHESLPIFGVQFHPEAALTEYGLTMLQNFIYTTKSVASQ